MHTIKVNITALKTRTLIIGYVGENERTQVRFECEGIFDEYPHAAPSLAIKPPVGDVYPVVVSREETDVVWDVSNADLQHEGSGELQLTFIKDGVVAKTVIGKLRISRSLLVTGEQPDVIQTWYDAATEKLAEVDAQIVELEGMVDTATDAATSAEQSASTASAKAEQAAGSAATATEKAIEATNAAGTATAKAAEAEQSALTATEKATAAAESERIATAKAGDATTAAGTATAKAGQATEAAQTATEKAGDASASATAAQESATDAASSATAASASETAAKASETAASTSATQAAQSVLDAGANAQTAILKAAEASQSATNAEASATNAATSAETASTKAGEAAQSAQAASDAKTAVEQTAEQLAESLEQIEQNTQDIAGTYSATKTYAVGDYVWYDGSLYRCTTAITTAEAWTSGHWTAAVLGDDVSDLKSAFSAFFKDDEVFETELSYTASTTLSQTVVYNGLIPAGCGYKVEAVTTGGVSRIDIKLGTYQTYNIPAGNKVTRNEIASTDIHTIQVQIPSDKVSQNGTLTVAVSVDNPFDKKVDKDQGSANAGKILVVNNSGKVALSDYIPDDKFVALTDYDSDMADLNSDIENIETSIGETEKEIRYLKKETLEFAISRSYTSGGFDENGNVITSSLYYRNPYVTSFPENKIKIRIKKEGIKAKLYFFSSPSLSQSTFISSSDWMMEDTTVDVPARSVSRERVFLCLMVGKIDGSNISYAEASGSAQYILYGSFDRLPVAEYIEGMTTSSGIAYYNANYHISGLYEVTPGETIKGVNVFAMAFFSNLNDHIQTISTETVVVPSNAKYVRILAKKGYVAAFGTEAELENIYFISESRIKTNSEETKVPQVYFENDYLPNKIKKIQSNTNAEKGMSFAFVTDMHVNDNSLVSGVLLEYILGRSTVPFIICGGDIPTAYSTEYGVEEAECEDEARRWIEYAQRFGWNRFFACRGNHDFMKPSPVASEQRIYYVAPEYQTYNYISRNNEHIVKRFPPHNYYYIDNISERMRIIVLDEYENGQYGTVETLTQTQVDWLLGDALNVENYKILIVSHEPFDTVWAHPDLTFAPIQALMKAIKNKTTINYTSGVNIIADYRETTLELIGHLCGHTHLDNYNVDDGVLTITTTCDAFYKKYEHNRVEGTITEPAFDIVSIDTQNKVIKLCRIGEGADRKIVYDGENVYTITQNLSNCFTCFQTTENVYGGSDWTNFYHADSGYSISTEDVSITMGGMDIKSSVWNQNSKRIYIPNITGNVVITISAT